MGTQQGDYSLDTNKPKGGGDNGAPLSSLPITRHGEDFVADHAVADGPSQVQPNGSGS